MAPSATSPSVPPGAPDVGPGVAPARDVLALDQHVPLRLTASRGALGLELYEPVELGPIVVTALRLTLPGLRFPIDLSGGVPKFRHRRGELEHLTLTADFAELERYLTKRVATAFGARPVSVWARPGGLGVGLVGKGQALAFDLLWAPQRGDARVVIANARGVGLEAPALASALRIVGSIFASVGERRGRSLRIAGVGRMLGRLLLPAVGARAPSAEGVQFGALSLAERRCQISLDLLELPAEFAAEATRALELCELVVDGDERLAEGEFDAARTAYVNALERAPRHPEIVRLIAEIDVRVSGRAEAALGLLVESLPATQSGLVGAELLAKIGDAAGARQAIEAAILHEPFAPVAALTLERLSVLEPEPALRRHALDRAVTRAPALFETRWARFGFRVEHGDIEGSIADAEHLEASETGARARQEICVRAARALLAAGHVRPAGRLFERALRYLPDDASATAGLARALVQSGKPRRALMLFERSLELAEQSGRLDAEALIDLARILADHNKDLPAAIARLRQVSASSERVVEARHLEGLYRARLGDRVGASLAFARMREAIELASGHQPAWIAWLVDAAENALGVDEEPLAAERHLAVAVRLTPQDETLLARYRDVLSQVAKRAR